LLLKRFYLILTVIISAVLLFACSRENNEPVEPTAAVLPGKDPVSPAPSEEKSGEAEAAKAPATISKTTAVPTTDTEFTEGVLIKKYPGNNACFTFETADGFQILSDPYMLNDTLSPDVVVESHQHGDHNDTSQVEGDYTLITEPGEYTFDQATIRGYMGVHNKADLPGGPNIIFVTKLEDITIAHFASQGDIPSDDVLDQIGRVDVLLIQIFENGTYGKLVPVNLPAIVNKLQPKIIIPEHGQDNADTVIAKKLNIASETVPSGSLILTRDKLKEMTEMKVFNLDHEVTK
jgi:hypothetical protein